jgi:hypothetical protein
MVEIKRYKTPGIYNQPVGVVRGETETARAFQQMSATAQRLFESQYQEAKAQQQTLGKNFAAVSVLGRDDAGNYESIEVPASFSPEAARSAKAGLLQNYVKRFAVDASETGKLTYAKYKETGDTEGFLQEWGQLTEGQIKAVSTDPELRQYAPLMQQMMDQTGKAHLASLRGISIDLAASRHYGTELALIEDRNSSLRALSRTDQTIALAPDDEMGEGEILAADKALIDQIESINQMRDNFPSKVPPEKYTQLVNDAYLARYSGNLDKFISGVKKVIRDRGIPVNAQDDQVGEILRGALAAFETGDIQDVRDSGIRSAMERFGLGQDFFSLPRMNALREKLGDELSEAVGRQTEEFNAFKDNYRRAAGREAATKGLPVDPKVTADILTEDHNIGNATDLANKLPELMKDRNFQKLMLHSISPPEVVKSMMSPDFASRHLAQNPEAYPAMMNLYRQMTLTQNGTVKSRMGFSKEDITFWNSLDTYSKSGRSINFREYLDLTNQFYEQGDVLQPMIKQKMVDEGYGQARSSYDNVLDEFVYKAVDENVEQAAFFRSLAPKLVHVHGAKVARQIIKDTKDKIFVKSDLMYRGEASMYAPEKYAVNDDQMNIFRTSVQTAIKQSENSALIKFGENVKLVPDRRGTPTGYPTYTLVYTKPVGRKQPGDRVMGASGPVEVGFNQLIATMSQRTRLSEANYARLAEESRLQNIRTSDLMRELTKDIYAP